MVKANLWCTIGRRSDSRRSWRRDRGASTPKEAASSCAGARRRQSHCQRRSQHQRRPPPTPFTMRRITRWPKRDIVHLLFSPNKSELITTLLVIHSNSYQLLKLLNPLFQKKEQFLMPWTSILTSIVPDNIAPNQDDCFFSNSDPMIFLLYYKVPLYTPEIPFLNLIFGRIEYDPFFQEIYMQGTVVSIYGCSTPILTGQDPRDAQRPSASTAAGSTTLPRWCWFARTEHGNWSESSQSSIFIFHVFPRSSIGSISPRWIKIGLVVGISKPLNPK